MNKIKLFYLINILGYPLLVGIVWFIAYLTTRRASLYSQAYAPLVIIFFSVIVCTIAFFVSLYVARRQLGAWWHAFPALIGGLAVVALGVFLILNPPSFKRTFDRNKIAGRTSYGLRRKATMRRDIPTGKFMNYYSSDTLAETGRGTIASFYGDEDILRQGEWKFYREDGTLDDVRRYKDNDLVSSQKYTLCLKKDLANTEHIYDIATGRLFNGTMDKAALVSPTRTIPFLHSGKVVNGDLEGTWLRYDNEPETPINMSGFIKQGGRSDGLFTFYYPSGKIESTKSYVDDKVSGISCGYYDTTDPNAEHGAMRYRITYLNDKKNGSARWWREDGTLSSEADFDDGVNVSGYRRYNEKGRLKSIELCDGSRNIDWEKSYDEKTGKLVKIEQDINIERIGRTEYEWGDDVVYKDLTENVRTIEQVHDGSSRVLVREAVDLDNIDKFSLKADLQFFTDYMLVRNWKSDTVTKIALYDKQTGKNIFADEEYLLSMCDTDLDLILYMDANKSRNPAGDLTLLYLRSMTRENVPVKEFFKGQTARWSYWNEFRIYEDDQDGGKVKVSFTSQTGLKPETTVRSYPPLQPASSNK